MTKATPAPANHYKPRVALTSRRGVYTVQSATHPGTSYTATAASCTCPARTRCKHMRFVRVLNVAFYVATPGRLAARS